MCECVCVYVCVILDSFINSVVGASYSCWFFTEKKLVFVCYKSVSGVCVYSFSWDVLQQRADLSQAHSNERTWTHKKRHQIQTQW